MIIEVTGNETDEQIKDAVWAMFCNGHPHEAHQHDPERFWMFFQTVCPNTTREQMEQMLKETATRTTEH